MKKIRRTINYIRKTPIRHHAKKVEELYEQYERKVGPVVMLIGFIVDYIAFTRIDLLFDTLVLVGYLCVAALGITLVNLYEGGVIKGKFFDRVRKWIPLLIQFAFGGLFSAFFVFYVKSASLVTSWPFFIVLLFLLVGNEFFRERYMRLTFHMSIYFLALFSFIMFYMPILTKDLGVGTFIISGFLSLGVIAVFIYALYRAIPHRIMQAKHGLIWSIVAIYIGVNFLYTANIIPPIPLAIKDSGVYHQVMRSGNNYVASEEVKKWYSVFGTETVHLTHWEPVYVYTAIFSPTDLDTKIVHTWQYQDEQGDWITSDVISYPIVGGRDEGYRGYSFKHSTFPGKWRVDVQTEDNRTIGRVRFNIESVDQPAYTTEEQL